MSLLLELRPGEKVDRWRIEKKIGHGGFGAVYMVSDSTGKYALKVEDIKEEIQLLKMEVFVLMELSKQKSKHFCEIQDKGRFGPFNYVVMTLVGKNLEDLRKAGKNRHLSMGTAIGVGIQALEALENMHFVGYLHRDVKPGNYTIGRPELGEVRKIYVLDFGLCRKFTNAMNVIRKPRAVAAFCGTLRYAAISCHMERELCRKDDVESWMYMQIELTTGKLPWKKIADREQVGEYKKRCRYEPAINELLRGSPPEMRKILRRVDSLKYYDKPPYRVIYNLMRRSFKTMRVQEFPYDWERKGFGVF